MRIHAEWDDDSRRVVRVIYERDWTWAEHHAHNEQLLRPMIEGAARAVHLIVDLRHSPYFQPAAFMQEVQRCAIASGTLPVAQVIFVTREQDIAHLLQTAYQRFSVNGCTYATAVDLAAARLMVNS